jgi:colanic acid biosynthesis protein WcaH
MAFIPEELYIQIMENVPILCVDLIVKNKGKILLVKRKNKPLKGHYWLPGGRVNKNEKLASAAKRKCLEECGIKVGKVKELGTYEYIGKDAIFDKVKTGIHTTSVVFEIKSPRQEIKVDKNHEDYIWVKPKDCPKDIKQILNSLI